MRYGYFMMPLHPPGSDPAATLQLDLEQIERLDELGFDEAWIGEHFTAEWENIPAPDLFIAAALQRTGQIKLGTGVACLPNHNPFRAGAYAGPAGHARVAARSDLDRWRTGRVRPQVAQVV
jgi:limonene 1,2-monooxygenase